MIWRFGSYDIDDGQREVSQGGRSVRITPTALYLLIELRPGRSRRRARSPAASATAYGWAGPR